MSLRASQSGFILIAGVILIVLVAFLGVAFTYLVSDSATSGADNTQSNQALFIADSGVERALRGFYEGATCGNLAYTGTIGAGSFTTSATLYNPTASTLSGAITSTATSLTLASAGSYAPTGGRVRIDSEDIRYASVSGNTLTGLTRGVAGSVAANHASGAAVYQNQCNITSVGSVGNTQRTTMRAVEGASTAQGSFPAGTTTIAGLGFRPVAVLFFWTRQATTGFQGVGPQSVNAGVGFAGGSSQAAVSITDNSGGKSDTGRRASASNSIIFLTGGGPPTLAGQAQVTAWNADGFSLQWAWSGTPNPYVVHYVAFGGDIVAAQAGQFTLTTAAGNQSVAGVGFQPDAVVFLWSVNGTWSLDSNIARSELGLGFASATFSQGSVVFAAADNSGSNSDKRWAQSISNAIVMLNTSNPPGLDAVVRLSGVDSNGFTLSKSNVPASNTPMFYLALKGGRHAIGSFNQGATVGTLAFQPQQLLFASFNLALGGLVANDVTVGSSTYSGAVSVGAMRGTGLDSLWWQDRSDKDPGRMNMYTSISDAITMATAPATLTASSTVNASATGICCDKSGFTLSWSPNDGIARQILYWAIGPSAGTSAIGWNEQFN